MEYKIYIKEYKYDSSEMSTVIKYKRCNSYTQKKENYQYMTEKYYITCIIKNAKYDNYKELLFSCTIDSNIFGLI